MRAKKNQCPACLRFYSDDSIFCSIDGSPVLFVDVDESAFADTLEVDESPKVPTGRQTSKLVPDDANMSQVASQWIKAFLSPMLDLVGVIAREFTNNRFIATVSGMGDDGKPHIYEVLFFPQTQWTALFNSRVGKYFLRNNPGIKSELEAFHDKMIDAERSLSELITALENSPVVVKALIDSYVQGTRDEGISHPFVDSNLQQITKLYLSKLHLPMARHPEATRNVIRFTAYSLLSLNVSVMAQSAGRDNLIPGIGLVVAIRVKNTNLLLSQYVERARQAFENIKREAPTFHHKLSQDLIEIAGRYNATIE